MKKILFFLFLLSLIACRPLTKDSYLKEYENFITKISNEEQNYTDKDWKSVDKKFEKFNTEWYDHFSDDLTISEKLTISKFHSKFIYYKSKSTFKKILN